MQATTEGKRGHIWDIFATVQPHSLGTGDKCPPPCVRILFGKVQQCSILHDQTTGDLKSHHLQANQSSICAPTFSFSSTYFFLRALTASSGGGGARAPQAPPLGSGTEFRTLNNLNNKKITQSCLHYIRLIVQR